MKYAIQIFIALAMTILIAPAHGIEIVGTGSYMPDPLMKDWGTQYSIKHPDVKISYKKTSTRDGIESVASVDILPGLKAGDSYGATR